MATEYRQIFMRSGNNVDLPVLQPREIGITMDTDPPKVYIGTTSAGNLEFSMIGGDTPEPTGTNLFLGDTGNKSLIGENNVATGMNSLKSLTSGGNNLVFGNNSGNSITTRSRNIIIGNNSTPSTPIFYDNIILGNESLVTDSSNNYRCVIIGHEICKNSTDNVQDSVAIGHQACINNGIGASVVIGSLAGQNVLSTAKRVQGSVIIGYQACQNKNVKTVVAIGPYALRGDESNTASVEATYNIAIGYRTLYNNTIGRNNIGIGFDSLAENTSGNYNVAVGDNCLIDSNHSNSVALGYHAGIGKENTNGCVYIGAWQGSFLRQDNISNEITLGFSVTGGGSNTITLGNNSITSLRCRVTTITSTSDSRTKQNIEPADKLLLADALRSIPVSRYEFNPSVIPEVTDKHLLGFIAQDVQKVFPKSVRTGSPIRLPVLDDEGNQTTTIHQKEGELIKVSALEDKQLIAAITSHGDLAEPLTYSGQKYKIYTRNGDKYIAEVTETEVPEFITTVEDPLEINTDFAIPVLWGVCQDLLARIEELERDKEVIS